MNKPNGNLATNATPGKMKVWEHGRIGKKPRFLINSGSVINLDSDFAHKLLCGGPTFTAGHACVFSCAFCYVETMMRKNAILNGLLEHKGLKHEEVVVEIDDPVQAARETLLLPDGKPRFADKKDRRVIYASPLVDVAGTPDQVKITIGICREILEHTHWHIRLLSKSRLLVNIARELSDHKARMIFGFSSGTLDDKVTRSFEIGTTSVSERLKALKELQAEKCRTFAMLCPILPHEDYREFAKQVSASINLDKCEDVWAEVLNPRGDAMAATSAALRSKNFSAEADALDRVASDQPEWNRYAEQTFLALAEIVPPGKFHFLQYIDKDDYAVWEKHQTRGAVLLGGYAKQMDAVAGAGVDPGSVEPLTAADRRLLEKNEEIVRQNLQEFVMVGLALKEIRDKKLYRQTHTSFEAYCLAEFDFGKSHSYRLIDAADARQLLQSGNSPIGDLLLPRTESQMRELLKVPEEKRVEVLKLARKKAGRRPLNALLIERAALELAPPPPKTGRASYYVAASYTTDQKVFLEWLEKLKDLALKGDKPELVRLLDKAITKKAILPDMPEMVLIQDVTSMFGWLSAMSPHRVEYKGQRYPNADSLFQMLRFDGHPEIQAKLMAAPSPLEVKLIARKHRRLLPEQAGQSDLMNMRLCLKLKVEQNPELQDQLLATGDKLIVDDCSARQKGEALYWGMANIRGQWVGDNWLGRLWMELRDQLKKK